MTREGWLDCIWQLFLMIGAVVLFVKSLDLWKEWRGK